jgi:hypothetical protein
MTQTESGFIRGRPIQRTDGLDRSSDDLAASFHPHIMLYCNRAENRNV